MKNIISKIQCFVDEDKLAQNCATFDFKTNEVKLGKVELNDKQIDRISFLLVHDLQSIASLISISEPLTANTVYKLIQNQ